MASSSACPNAYEVLQVREPAKSAGLLWSILLLGQEQRIRRWAWRGHGRLLPLLHWLDGAGSVPETFVNLRVLWNKAFSSINTRSPAYEGPCNFLTYRMLPRSTRWILNGVPACFFPLHANIELRTVYLDRAVGQEIDRILGEQRDPSRESGAKIRLVVLGGGYDIRSIKLLADRRIQQAWEFDLPPVMESKMRLLEKRKLLQPNGRDHRVDDPTKFQLRGVDLNQPDVLTSTLTDMVKESASQDCDGDVWHTIVVAEALFLYLEPGVPARLLQSCRDALRGGVSLCFADRLEEIKGETGREAGRAWFSAIGWELVDWLPKVGATQHMGIARPVRDPAHERLGGVAPQPLEPAS